MKSIDDVEKEVARIEALADDYEAAHGAEDSLYEAVLREVAKGYGRHAAMAAAALKTKELDFARYCA